MCAREFGRLLYNRCCRAVSEASLIAPGGVLSLKSSGSFQINGQDSPQNFGRDKSHHFTCHYVKSQRGLSSHFANFRTPSELKRLDSQSPSCHLLQTVPESAAISPQGQDKHSPIQSYVSSFPRDFLKSIQIASSAIGRFSSVAVPRFPRFNLINNG